MKITKEKVIYFLSLNLAPYIFIIPFYLLVAGLNHPKTIFGFHFIIFPASIIAFIYAFYKKSDYNIFIGAVFALMPALFFVMITFLAVDFGVSFYDILAGVYVFVISFPIVFIFSLIVLAITNPLRKKIKW